MKKSTDYALRDLMRNPQWLRVRHAKQADFLNQKGKSTSENVFNEFRCDVLI